MAIIIPKNEIEIMKKHAADIFPYEACGGLIGKIEGENKIIVKAYPAENRYGKITWDSFEIEPKDILKMDKFCMKENLDINASWPFYSYIIISVNGNKIESVADIKSYLMPDRASNPIEEEVIIN